MRAKAVRLAESVGKYNVVKASFFELGAQFAEPPQANGNLCQFLPPADVYFGGHGGIENVRWMMNPWAEASPSEVSSGCVSGNCLRISGMRSGSGFHIYYRQSFNPTVFKTLHFSTRAESGSAVISATLTGDGTPCATTKTNVTESWTASTLDLATNCAGSGSVNTVTFYAETAHTLLIDELRFEP